MTEPLFPIVGIGASAGGVPAMEGFFKGVAPDTGMAFVVVTHLSPDRESLLHEVIGRYTSMPVLIAEQDTEVVVNTVYVMPQNAIITIEAGVLRIREPHLVGRERKPVDIFFASLAEDRGELAVGVILSGGDGDGTLGGKAIKEHGGLVLAQISDAYGPSNPSMPNSAISTGIVDIQSTAEEMGARLKEFMDGTFTFDELTHADGSEEDTVLQRARAEIYALLRARSGHDFSGYKTKTFLRRVRRRMQVQQSQSIESYIELLKREPAEVTSLFRDLLIGVTNFFRDAEAFALLEEHIIPRLFEGRGPNDTIRIWVPGCATGEEVYSIGILMRERMSKMSAPPRVQIFATDIDEAALSVARLARYPEPLLEGLSTERKERFFHHDGAVYVLNSDVRELCIFSPHSVFRDPPFSRMDMVSCRNLLIYLGPDIQNRVIPTFHYSLRPNGYLFLGTSEGIGQHGDLFAMVDKKQRIFQAREHAAPPRLPNLVGDHRLPAFGHDRRDRLPQTQFPLRQAVEALVMDRFSPAHVVVNSEGDVVYYSARTGRFLEPSQGAPTRQLLTMARRGLRLELRATLREVASVQGTVTKENVPLDDDDGRVQMVTITAEPMPDRGNGETLYIVLFEPSGPPRAPSGVERSSQSVEGLEDIDREMRETRERLQSTIEEYETAVEELKSSNEELVSVNEEAQSTNEELEASKEEMQSLNEELNTINAELIAKVEELDRANNDLHNLFESAEIATVFLDRKLVIRNFTPAASTFFNLRISDIGRPLTDLSNRLDYPDLKTHIDRVFDSGKVIEHQLPRDDERRYYLARLMPYREEAKTIQGVVVSLIDVTRLAEAEEHQQVLISELNHRVKNMLAVVISIANSTLEAAPAHPAHEALLGRLRAMARAYGALSRVNWTQVDIGEIARDELTPFGIERFEFDGPGIKLETQMALSLSMVIHELATNAAKYGALSGPKGKVRLQWETKNTDLHLEWQERDGPAVVPPKSSGFGLALLDGEITYRHGGTVQTQFDPDGLKVSISLPLRS
ncbi:MAG: chemotaxis protein CheR [Devosia sp.]|nr:chemotaxis protein CheR [Devosia sp.]